MPPHSAWAHFPSAAASEVQGQLTHSNDPGASSYNYNRWQGACGRSIITPAHPLTHGRQVTGPALLQSQCQDWLIHCSSSRTSIRPAQAKCRTCSLLRGEGSEGICSLPRLLHEWQGQRSLAHTLTSDSSTPLSRGSTALSYLVKVEGLLSQVVPLVRDGPALQCAAFSEGLGQLCAAPGHPHGLQQLILKMFFITVNNKIFPPHFTVILATDSPYFPHVIC